LPSDFLEYCRCYVFNSAPTHPAIFLEEHRPAIPHLNLRQALK
jgi:hypothetical protein